MQWLVHERTILHSTLNDLVANIATRFTNLPFCQGILFCCPISLDTLGAHSNALGGLGFSACKS